MSKWAEACSQGNCIAIGDLNLNFMKWDDPEARHADMINLTQSEIEMKGSSQIIRGATRGWRLQEDSQLDHIWVNCSEKIVNHFNVVRGVSDHHVIGATIATKKMKIGSLNISKGGFGENFDETKML